MNKNTLYITFDGLSDPLGQSQILPYICGIASSGFSITILSCEKKDRLDKEKKNIEALIKDLPISWEYIIYDVSGNFLSRLGYIRKIKSLAKKIHIQKKLSLIHCRSYLASLIGLSFKLEHKVAFVFDMRGFWADERIDGGIWKMNNLLHHLFYYYFKKKEKQFLLYSDAIVSLTNAAVAELEKNNSDAELKNKITVIPCCTDLNLFNTKDNLGFPIPQDLLPTDHIIIYTGSIGTWYFTKEMIDCILVWKQSIPNIKLLILTKDMEALDKILSAYSKEEQSIIVTASATYKDVPVWLSLAKAAIFFIKPSYSKIASSPTKMAECWAMNLPIITNPRIGDNDLYFNNHKGGVLVNEFKTAAYEAACRTYSDLLKEKRNYREIAINYFDTKMAIEKYISIYNRITK